MDIAELAVEAIAAVPEVKKTRRGVSKKKVIGETTATI
jgi:hypothetical protein